MITSVCAAALCCHGAAYAQTAAPVASPKADVNSDQAASGAASPTAADSINEGLAEIVVTAQKRAENVQKVPISIAVVTSDDLAAAGITNTQSLKMLAPGLEIQSNNGFALPILRGVGSKVFIAGFEPALATYVDDVYYATPTGNLFSFNNISQVEVLKGPQGTLFGRNATDGLIQVKTKDPTQTFSGNGSVTYGNYETFRTSGYMTGGVTDNVAADFAVNFDTQGQGYGTDLTTGKDVYKVDHDLSLRSKWIAQLDEDTKARLILDYFDTRNSMNATRVPVGSTIPAPYGPTYGGKPWDIASDVQPLVTTKAGGVSLRVDQDEGAVSIASVTAYRRTAFLTLYDFDYTPTRGRYGDVAQNDWQVSQELQVLSNGGGPLTWVAGLYYFRANSTYPYADIGFLGPSALPTVPPTVLTDTISSNDTNSLAGFGQATLEILPGLKLTGGLRYTSESKSISDAMTTATHIDGSLKTTIPNFSASQAYDKITYRAAVDYQATHDILLYASDNRGFKSGGFNSSVLQIPAYKPEVLDDYEGGFKSTWLDHRIKFNADMFYYDYQNIQVNELINGGTGVANGARATIYGLETELEFELTHELSLQTGFQSLHGKYDSFPDIVIGKPRAAGGYSINPVGNATGNTTIFSPTSTVSASLAYDTSRFGNRAGANVGVYYNSGYFQDPDNVIRQPSYVLLTASVHYEISDGTKVSLWGNNLTDAVVTNIGGLQSFGATGVNRANYAPPRTFGVTVDKSF